MQSGKDTYTIEDIYNLPVGKRAELIDGQIYYMSMPKRKHQDISGKLCRVIYEYIHSYKENCKTGLLRLFLLRVSRWIIIESFSSMPIQV